jgi:hypothetical protein
MNQPPQDPLELTEKHIAIVTNQVLQTITGVLSGAKNSFEASKALDPLVNAFSALHNGMVSSRQARAAQPDPQAQLQLEEQKMQHQHALDLMAQQNEERQAEFKQQLEQQKLEHQMQLAERKAQADEERAGIEHLSKVKQIQQQEEAHAQQQQHAQQNQEQTLSNTDEMHKVQVQQAKAKPTESGSEN